ncbi:NUDIX domain-containing protein [Candidatus Saccharibacteria bacterium]|nr:NUDIX domain-containing protein [Candidatus Saccharibacteria bacterium]
MNVVTARDVFGKQHLVDVSDLTQDAHIYGIAVEGEKILIVPQFDGYDFPGGTIKNGETHGEALRREFKEETGLEIEPIKLLNVYTSFFHHQKYGTNYQSLLIFYLVKIVGGTISADGFDEDEKEYASEAEWKNIDDLKEMRHVCSIDVASEIIASTKAASYSR